ncbi:apolipoprotein N-acyltransferase [Mycobacterium sp.]|uniref:apolipoprotein N-acyltransferase n=1 Tax=Mycobacterium sp. TaxID=1785 RepID=UPI0031D43566
MGSGAAPVTAAGARALPARASRLAGAIAGGALLYASFPPHGWWWAAIAAFALLSWVLTRPAVTPAGGLGYGGLFGLAFYLPLLPWVGAVIGAWIAIVLAVVCAVFPAVFGLLAVAVRRLPGWPVCFAVLWAAQEWLKASVPFGGFPWGAVAIGHTGGPLLPLLRLGGVPLLSTAIVLTGCSAAAIGAAIGSRHGRDTWWRALVLPCGCIGLVVAAAAATWPQVRQSATPAAEQAAVTVAVVQGNVPRLGFGFNAQRRAVLDNHVDETLRLAGDVRAGIAPQPRFVIWPENSSDIDPLLNSDAAQQISMAARAVDAPILVGAVLDVTGRLPDDPAYTNTVIVWNPGTGPADRHDKQIVQQFGETLPWRGFFRHFSGFADLAGHIVPGRSTGMVRAAGVPVGIATCWEVIFDRAPRESVRNGAQLLAVPTNNATFTETMSEQQLAFARVRAVEHDRYVVVAGTTGISAVIAPDGVELARTDFFAPAYLDDRVGLVTTLTPATRWGATVQWVLLGSAGAVLLAAALHSRWSRRGRR